MTRTPLRAARREELVGIVGWPQETNELIVDAWRDIGVPAGMLSPADARLLLGRHDVAIGRFDVRASLDGVQPGFEVLTELERDGVRVINGADALLNAHDKLRTTRLLVDAGLPHPKTVHVRSPGEATGIGPPVVVKPRFGSWGTDVFRCETELDVARTLTEISSRSWFMKHGALIQELVPPVGRDLRLVVAAGQVVGAIERVARPGEWRTNVALGGTRRPTRPIARGLRSRSKGRLAHRRRPRGGRSSARPRRLRRPRAERCRRVRQNVRPRRIERLRGGRDRTHAPAAAIIGACVAIHCSDAYLRTTTTRAYLSAHRSARPPMALLHGRARLCTDHESYSYSPFDPRHAPAGGRDRRSASPDHRRAGTVGGDESGPAPHELLPAALAACVSTTLVMYARTKGWELDDVMVEVDYDHRSTPRRFDDHDRLSGDLTTHSSRASRRSRVRARFAARSRPASSSSRRSRFTRVWPAVDPVTAGGAS